MEREKMFENLIDKAADLSNAVRLVNQALYAILIQCSMEDMKEGIEGAIEILSKVKSNLLSEIPEWESIPPPENSAFRRLSPAALPRSL